MFRFPLQVRNGAFVGAWLVTLGCPMLTPASADEVYRPVSDPLVAKECRACHMLYPVGLLTAASWQRLVAGLKDHFGENAEVDDATAQHLVAYLSANAGNGGKKLRHPAAPAAAPAVAPIRITELAWFIRKHRGDRISPATLLRRKAKSAADCLPCHQRGEQGDFGD